MAGKKVPQGVPTVSSSRVFDPDSYTIRDSALNHPHDKGAKTADAMNPVPRRTGLIPPKPTSARGDF